MIHFVVLLPYFNDLYFNFVLNTPTTITHIYKKLFFAISNNIKFCKDDPFINFLFYFLSTSTRDRERSKK